MKLHHAEWDFAPDLTQCNRIVCESPRWLCRYTDMLYSQMQGGAGEFFILENYDKLEPRKVLHWVGSPYGVSLQDRKLQTAFYKEMERDVQETAWEEWIQVQGNVVCFLESILANNFIPAEMKDEFTLADMFKLAGLHLTQDETGNTPQRLLDYALAIRHYLAPTALILVQMRDYFTAEELSAFYRETQAVGLGITMWESHCSTIQVKEECTYVIDEDGCSIW